MENIINSADQIFAPFPVPGSSTGKLSARLLNVDTKYGPVIGELRMEAGAFIPAHIHHKTDEQHYVLEGDFVNDGISYAPGTFFAHDPGQIHGPHSTINGCRVLFIQSKQVDPNDFEMVNAS